MSVPVKIALLVECGMSARQAFAASTIESAEMLSLDGQIGSIEGGKCADLALLDGDPLEDIAAHRRIREVIFGGRLLSGTFSEEGSLV